MDGNPTISDSEFATAYEGGYALTVGYLMSHGISHDMASDAAQSGWARGWEKRSQLQDRDKLTPWINQISLNMFRRRFRHEMREYTGDTAASPAINASVIDLRYALGRSPSRDRDLLRSYYLEGYSSQELGIRERCSPVAIRVRIMRARRRLVDALTDAYHPSGRRRRRRGKAGDSPASRAIEVP